MTNSAHIVFGNVNEMTALADLLNLKFKTPTHIPFLLNRFKNKNVKSFNHAKWFMAGSTFIMTQGSVAPAIIVWGNGESAEVPPYAPISPVRDTTGAGDALVAGFLASLLNDKDPKTCLDWGCKVASEVVTNIGATLSNDFIAQFLNNHHA